jgi:hypothetical protein
VTQIEVSIVCMKRWFPLDMFPLCIEESQSPCILILLLRNASPAAASRSRDGRADARFEPGRRGVFCKEKERNVFQSPGGHLFANLPHLHVYRWRSYDPNGSLHNLHTKLVCIGYVVLAKRLFPMHELHSRS